LAFEEALLAFAERINPDVASLLVLMPKYRNCRAEWSRKLKREKSANRGSMKSEEREIERG
jgi:hypothetical protein